MQGSAYACGICTSQNNKKRNVSSVKKTTKSNTLKGKIISKWWIGTEWDIQKHCALTKDKHDYLLWLLIQTIIIEW
jgi:hypothetical protein